MQSVIIIAGGLSGSRTRDTRLKRPVLYQLSYQPMSVKYHSIKTYYLKEAGGINIFAKVLAQFYYSINAENKNPH